MLIILLFFLLLFLCLILSCACCLGSCCPPVLQAPWAQFSLQFLFLFSVYFLSAIRSDDGLSGWNENIFWKEKKFLGFFFFFWRAMRPVVTTRAYFFSSSLHTLCEVNVFLSLSFLLLLRIAKKRRTIYRDWETFDDRLCCVLVTACNLMFLAALLEGCEKKKKR